MNLKECFEKYNLFFMRTGRNLIVYDRSGNVVGSAFLDGDQSKANGINGNYKTFIQMALDEYNLKKDGQNND